MLRRGAGATRRTARRAQASRGPRVLTLVLQVLQAQLQLEDPLLLVVGPQLARVVRKLLLAVACQLLGEDRQLVLKLLV